MWGNQVGRAHVEERTTSRVVTPKSLLGSKTPAALRTSAAMGTCSPNLHEISCPNLGRSSNRGGRTVELTGLEMTQMKALGQNSAQALTRSRTIPALMLKRSL